MCYTIEAERGDITVDQIRNEKIINIPNALTVLRIALLPAGVWRYIHGDSRGALFYYIVAMLTDAVDGFIARHFNQITSLGKLLDPIADKLSLLTLITLFVMDGQIPMWVLLVILMKEAALVAGSAVAFRRGMIVHALPIGKVTTGTFVLSMVARFLALRETADVLLGVSLVLSIAALGWYSYVVLKKLHTQREEAIAS